MDIEEKQRQSQADNSILQSEVAQLKSALIEVVDHNDKVSLRFHLLLIFFNYSCNTNCKVKQLKTRVWSMLTYRSRANFKRLTRLWKSWRPHWTRPRMDSSKRASTSWEPPQTRMQVSSQVLKPQGNLISARRSKGIKTILDNLPRKMDLNLPPNWILTAEELHWLQRPIKPFLLFLLNAALSY